jgi:8-oxo-dGTP pyrophosphatase MutT (NUDIX family)
MQAKVNKTSTLHQGRTFRLIEENVTLPSGAVTDLDIIRHPGAAAVVAMFPDNRVLMLKQYRHAVGRYIWEIPAGTLGVEETGIHCAKREIIEETGYRADSWTELGSITPLPGYSDERIYLFLARDLSPAAQHLDFDEVLSVHEIPLEETFNMVQNGSIQDAKTICALYLVRDHI